MVDSHTNYNQNLANDLKEYGKGYSYESLKRMGMIASEFSFEEIRSQAGTKIPWRTLVKILYKSNFKYDELFSQPRKKYMSRLARVF